MYASLHSFRTVPLGAIPSMHKTWIPPGELGTETTVSAMVGLVREGASQPVVRRVASSILASVDPSDDAARAAKVREWLLAHFLFVDDPIGVGVFGHPNEDIELLRAPLLQLQAIAATGMSEGDCDDAAILGGALARAAGFPVQLVVVGFDPAGPFTHVYAEVLVNGAWQELDVTRTGTVPVVRRRRVFHV